MEIFLDDREIRILKVLAVFSTVVITAFVGMILLFRLLWGDLSVVAELWAGIISSVIFGVAYVAISDRTG